MLIEMPSPRGTNREGLFIDVPSRGATDADIPLRMRPRRYGDRRLGRDEEETRQGYLAALANQIAALPPEEREALLEALNDAPGEDRRRRARDRRARDDHDYPVERRDIADPGAIGGLYGEMPGDRRRAADEPPPFYGRPRPGGSVDLTERPLATREGEDRRRHALDQALRIKVDTTGVQAPRVAPRRGLAFDRRWPSAARIRVL